jgi:SAM-dependent MidA family methyltransferase
VQEVGAEQGRNNTSSSLALKNVIVQRISESGCDRITFAEFMELALYHPQHGYYGAARPKIGSRGDFFTASHLGADFGELLAEQVRQFWQALDCPQPFTLVEMGAGQGLLAADLLGDLQRQCNGFLEQLDYVIVERSPIHIAEQQQQLQRLVDAGAKIRWCGLDELPADSVTGCFFSNELVDALPVHQVVVQAGQLQEVFVTTEDRTGTNEPGDRGFVEVIAPLSTPLLADYFQQIGIDLLSGNYPDGYRTEVNLAALDWMETVAARLHRGYVLTIDYGYPSDRYYHPARSQGTLQCYYRHTHHGNPYVHLGEQDMTAHVDFTALQHQGERSGLQTVELTKQAAFLMRLGLGDRMIQLSQSETTDVRQIQTLLQRRDALHTLINPMGMGNFGVLIQCKASGLD